jgi:hypothetical protein
VSYIIRVTLPSPSKGMTDAWLRDGGVYDAVRSRARRFVTIREAEQAAADIPISYKPKIETT